MTLIDLANYVNLDVDDTFTNVEIGRWFNKGISQYNLIPPLTTYPVIQLATDPEDDDLYYLDTELNTVYSDTFLLGIVLPFINGSVKAQEASVSERQLAYQDFLQNARMFKASTNIPYAYMLNRQNSDLSVYQLGENVYVSDMRTSPVQDAWSRPAVYTEIVNEEDDS